MVDGFLDGEFPICSGIPEQKNRRPQGKPLSGGLLVTKADITLDRYISGIVMVWGAILPPQGLLVTKSCIMSQGGWFLDGEFPICS